MGYSEEALAFSTIPPGHQIRAEDRISYLYLEYCLVRQDRTGVVAIRDVGGDEAQVDRIQLPVSGVGVLCLGPGTSISHAAMTSCTRSGCTVVFTGGGGVNAYSYATPLTASSKWAIAQARLISNQKFQRVAALELYKRQFGLEHMPGGTIAAMRGMEGRIMRDTYRDQAKKMRISGFKRDTKAEDAVNTGLNIANSIMYGVAATACAAIGVNPSLGIIHRGDARSLLFDLADLYKARIVLPLVFSHAHDEDPVEAIRRDLRQQIHKRKIIADMIDALMVVLTPHLPNRDDDRLIDDGGEEVDGHVQYGKDD
ncbi:CRISPR-associated protein Cas1 [Arcanobacterium pluranimalium]|uniref:type I-E CRISPR-associated endonuclease Cas1e n=1 Tax=Arcanobacterium pluranimalium TaxID=108028 RepID=UPI0019579111|nr:type I-E CRISPR-associated endonuclease Cas1e [Arcanobacterium pluranimalium]MBM7824573.1 CRISPR-associated protein Cas1 [Arcanobacterium pluranimalium]